MKNKIISIIFILIFSISLSGCLNIFGNYNELEDGGTTDGCTVSFVSNTNSQVSPILVPTNDRVPESGTFDILEREGYLFLGWYNNSAFTGNSIDYIVGITQNVTLYAKWLEVTANEDDIEIETTYTIFFEASGGFGTMGSQSFTSGEEVTLLTNTYLPPYSGVSFAGWSLTSSGEVAYTNEQAVTLTSDITLYAVWAVRELYSVTFNASGSTGSMNPYQFVYGGEFLVPGSTFNSPYRGVFCPGWATAPGGDIVYKPGDIVVITESLTLYAVWKATINLNFNANGGSGTMNTQGFYAGESKTIKANTFTAPSATKKFGGWAKSVAGAVVCEDMGTYSITGDTTFYAIWVNREYCTITFNGNGSVSYMTNQQIEKNVEGILNANTILPPYRDIVFAGWSLTSSGEVAYIDKQSIVLSDDITLYAKWVVVHTFTITFYPNGGRGDAYTKALLQNSLVQIPTTEFSPAYSGIAFVGWATSPDGEVVYTDKQVTKFTSNMSLYAKWSIYYKVYFNSMGGSGVNTTAGLKGTRVPYEGVFASPTKATAIFGGWFTEANGQGTQYSYVENINGEFTLYAYWIYTYAVGQIITVRLDLRYGNLFLTETTEYGCRIPTSGSFTVPTREGYEFLGWYTGTDGFGDRVYYLDEVMQNTTLYAYWKYVADKALVTVSLNTQGGSVLQNVVVTYGERAPLSGPLPNPYKTGYIFCGWFSELSGQGTQYTYIPSLTSNITIYAYWRLDVSNKYVINFNSIGGTALDNIYTLSGKRAPSIGNFEIPQREGYTFIGWYNEIGGNGTKYEYVGSVNADVFLYAYWQINTYTITFDSEGGSSEATLMGDYGMRMPAIGYFNKPTKSDSVFMGWFTGDNGTGTHIKYVKNLKENVALYARWHKIDASVERAESNYSYNKTAQASFTGFDSSGYIQNQTLTSVFKYGKYYADYNGCGWIATYNALRYLQIKGLYEDEIVIADIIRYFDHYGLFMDGTFGTILGAIESYFKDEGYEVNIYLDTTKFNEIIRDSDIAVSWRLITDFTGHYVTMHSIGEGFKGYNGERYFNSYQDYMETDGDGIYYLISINLK